MRGEESAREVDEVREKKDSRNSIINNLGKIIKF